MPGVKQSFMWGYQDHVRISFQVTAEGLFDSLDKDLKPDCFFIGLLHDHNLDRHPIYLVPEDCGYDVKAFLNLKRLAVELERIDEESNIIQSHPIAQENQQKRIKERSLAKAIEKILYKEDAYGKTVKFVSSPTLVEGLNVFTILELQKEALEKHYRLTKGKMDDRYTIHRSLIESAISVFLEECAYALNSPNEITGIQRTVDEITKIAAKKFLYTVAQVGKNYLGLHSLFDSINAISSLKYEGSDGIGKMVIAPKDHQNINIWLRLKEPIQLNNFRKVRKFLELSDGSDAIISDSALIYGLGSLKGKYNPNEESIFTIEFTSHYNWKVLHDENELMVMDYLTPSLPKEKVVRAKFYSDLKRILQGIEKKQIDSLWDIIIAATKQKKGTMVIISDEAESESKRLANQGTLIEPLKTTEQIVNQITSIDGGILVDRDSMCYAIGVILDGIATKKGDSSRGSRYNSAVRYFEHFGKQYPTLIVCVSEDGMVDLIPNLMPQIKHSLIVKAILILKKIESSKDVDTKEFNKIMSFFQNVSFYLSIEECNAINESRKLIEKEQEKTEGLWIKYGDFYPSQDMNESYYLRE